MRADWSFAYLRLLARQAAPRIHPGGRHATAVLLAHLDSTPGSSVLEIGCGTGATAVLLASRGVRVTAVDLLPEMLAESRRRSIVTRCTLALVRSDATEGLPFASASFDRAYAESVLGMYDAPEADAVLRAIHRVLRPGGRFVANEAVWREHAVTCAPAVAAHCVERFGLPPASLDGSTIDLWIARMAAVGFAVDARPLATCARPRGTHGPESGTRRVMAASAAYSAARRFGAWLIPSVAREAQRFRRALAAPGSAPLTDAWLFVLTKGGP